MIPDLVSTAIKVQGILRVYSHTRCQWGCKNTVSRMRSSSTTKVSTSMTKTLINTRKPRRGCRTEKAQLEAGWRNKFTMNRLNHNWPCLNKKTTNWNLIMPLWELRTSYSRDSWAILKISLPRRLSQLLPSHQ
jgi:hypothetical protein